MPQDLTQDGSRDELEYRPESAPYSSSVHAFLDVLLLCAIAIGVGAVAATSMGLPDLTPVYAIVVFFALYVIRRRRPKPPHVVLRVRNHALELDWRDPSGWRGAPKRTERVTVIPFESLTNVLLDTKTIERVVENPSGTFPELRFINATVGPKLDEARIELTCPEGPLWLTPTRQSHTDATDWCRKLRLLLRHHGRIPGDERSPPIPPRKRHRKRRPPAPKEPRLSPHDDE